MKTRVGKIAQLPKEIRDELNQRLQNGKQGPELLRWLNALPETKELLAEKFDAVPLSKQNLSEWRQGGYKEWLRHQERENRIQRVMEEGTSLGEHDANSADDLFENSARIALAELMADFDTLHELKGEARSKRLLTLTRELSRLQYAYNHSRWTALGYSKWNDRFLGPEDYEEEETNKNQDCDKEPERSYGCSSPSPPRSGGLELLGKQRKESAGGGSPPRAERAGASESLGRGEVVLRAQGETCILQSELNSAVSSCTRQGITTAETAESFTPSPISDEPPEVKPSNTTSNEGEVDDRVYLHRTIYHHKNCGHICRDCHSEDGGFPYSEAIKDSTEAKQLGVQAFWRGRTMIVTHPTECTCPCDQC